MERRKFLIGAGSLAAGSAAAMGTGAFTSVTAQRGVTVNVADDASALLAIEPETGSPNADVYVHTHDGTVSVEVGEGSHWENAQGAGNSYQGGDGINKDATTVIDDLLRIKNLGTQPVIVGHRQSWQPSKGAFYHEDQDVDLLGNDSHFSVSGTPDNRGITNLDTADSKNLPVLAPGETLNNIGFFATPDADPEEDFIDGTITFTAGADPSDIGL